MMRTDMLLQIPTLRKATATNSSGSAQPVGLLGCTTADGTQSLVLFQPQRWLTREDFKTPHLQLSEGAEIPQVSFCPYEIGVLNNASKQLKEFDISDFTSGGLQTFPVQSIALVELYALTLLSQNIDTSTMCEHILANPLRASRGFDVAWNRAFQAVIGHAAHSFFKAGLFGGQAIVDEINRILAYLDGMNHPALTDRETWLRWRDHWASGSPFTQEDSRGFPGWIAMFITKLHLLPREGRK